MVRVPGASYYFIQQIEFVDKVRKHRQSRIMFSNNKALILLAISIVANTTLCISIYISLVIFCFYNICSRLVANPSYLLCPPRRLHRPPLSLSRPLALSF
jgi:hypothetical protein